MEGSFVGFVFLLVAIYNNDHIYKSVMVAIMHSLLETFTTQNDNFILPLHLFCLLHVIY